MTKNEYEHAKIINLREFINSLESQLMTGTITGRNKIAQAKRQLKQAKLKINEYMVNFWNEYDKIRPEQSGFIF